jgi:hypothetical protein
VRAVQVVAAIGGDERESLVRRVAHEEAQQVARRAVGPVQVLDDQQHGRHAPEPHERAEQQLEQPRLPEAGGLRRRRLDLAEVRHEARQLPARGTEHLDQVVGIELRGQRPQRADDRRVRQLGVADLDAVPEQHDHAVLARLLRDLADEPALADARLARDQDARGLAGRGGGDRGTQHLELTFPSHQSGARQASGHAADHRGPAGDWQAPL